MESGLDGGFVRDDLRLFTQRGYVKIRFVATPVENRQGNGGGERPNACTAFEKTAQLAGRCADRTGQADGREEGGTRCADVGIGLFEQVFCGADVGTVQQHFGTQAGRQSGDFELFAQRQRGRQVFRQGLVN